MGMSQASGEWKLAQWSAAQGGAGVALPPLLPLTVYQQATAGRKD